MDVYLYVCVPVKYYNRVMNNGERQLFNTRQRYVVASLFNSNTHNISPYSRSLSIFLFKSTDEPCPVYSIELASFP